MLHEIGWAIEQMRYGRKVRRVGWNKRDQWLRIQEPDSESFMSEPYIYLEKMIEVVTNIGGYDKAYRIPWLASQADLLTADWEVVDEIKDQP